MQFLKGSRDARNIASLGKLVPIYVSIRRIFIQSHRWHSVILSESLSFSGGKLFERILCVAREARFDVLLSSHTGGILPCDLSARCAQLEYSNLSESLRFPGGKLFDRNFRVTREARFDVLLSSPTGGILLRDLSARHAQLEYSTLSESLRFSCGKLFDRILCVARKARFDVLLSSHTGGILPRDLSARCAQLEYSTLSESLRFPGGKLFDRNFRVARKARFDVLLSSHTGGILPATCPHVTRNSNIPPFQNLSSFPAGNFSIGFSASTKILKKRNDFRKASERPVYSRKSRTSRRILS
jgi:hypothetical protein